MDNLEREKTFQSGMETFEEFKGAGVYADLLLDLTFKKAFNPDTQNKICLIALLNAVLEGEISAPIRDVHSRNKECSGGSNENRISGLSVKRIPENRHPFHYVSFGYPK